MENETDFNSDKLSVDDCSQLSDVKDANCTRNLSWMTTSYSGLILLPEPNLWCLTLVLLPATCIFGNFLVVLAVLSEKSLKTSTNFLLVSLACADLLVGTLVMPFSVYLTINRLNWFLPDAVCNFFCVADVSASTASIVHLVAISVDRFYAVVRHMEYKSPKHKRRIYCTILFTWIFSIGIGLPLGIGMNQTVSSDSIKAYQCGIVNPDYMLYMSIFSFYIPCLVMLIMYGFVFYRLHKRMKAVELQEMAAGQMVQFGDNLGNIFQHAYGTTTKIQQASILWAVPFLKTIEATIAENEDVSTEELDELTVILNTLESNPRHRVQPENSSDGRRGLFETTRGRMTTVLNSARRRFSSRANQTNFMENKNGNANGFERGLRRRPSLYVAKQKIKTLKDRAIDLLMRLRSRQGMAIRKETRATKLVATVMLVFLLCYMPFFTLNLIKVFMLRTNTWNYNLEGLFIFFTWLGYVNSCLNPLIYSLFNRKFRASFQKLLHCTRERSEYSQTRQKRLSRIIADSDERKTWRQTSSPKGKVYLTRRTPTTTAASPHRNGILSKISKQLTSPEQNIQLDLIHQRITNLQNGTKSSPRKSNSKSDGSSISNIIQSMSSEKLEVDFVEEDDEEATGSDYDADEEPSSRGHRLSRVIDAELIMLRKAQFSGYHLLFDQVLDFNDPVEV